MIRNSILLLFSIILTACRPDALSEFFETPEAMITGNDYEQFLPTPDKPETRLEEGAAISIYASGGLQADNIQLTYHNGIWIGQEDLKWDDTEAEGTVYAFCPSIPAEGIALYQTDGSLTDLLYDQQIQKHGTSFRLKFRHHFSRLALTLEKQLNKQLSSINITPSVSISEIELPQGTLKYTNEKRTTSLSRQEDLTYYFIVPPASDMSVDIHLYLNNGKELRAELSSLDYSPGEQYAYRLTEANDGGGEGECGIRNAEDFIAFTHLINGESYPERTLNEFGKEENGQTTYYLLNDIRFTEEESKEVQLIGYRALQSSGFKDCFDGQGHTLYDLVMTEKTSKSNKAQGLFCFVEENGIIKDLNLNNFSLTYSSKNSSYAAWLTGVNLGTITGCSVRNSQLYTPKENNYIGSITGSNSGTIINCAAINNIFDCSQSLVGGIAAYNKELIINSYMSGCDFKKTKEAGGLCHHLEIYTSNIENCYVYHASYKTNTKTHFLLAHNLYADRISECYYTPEYNLLPYPQNYNGNTSYPYDSNTLQLTDGTPLIARLNTWVKANQSAYPACPPWQWTEGENPPIILLQP